MTRDSLPQLSLTFQTVLFWPQKKRVRVLEASDGWGSPHSFVPYTSLDDGKAQLRQTLRLTRFSDRLSVSETLVFVGGPAGCSSTCQAGMLLANGWQMRLFLRRNSVNSEQSMS
jgi:hypothetical protein